MEFIGYGGKEIKERVLNSAEVKKKLKDLVTIEIKGRIARECIGLGYGFFTPLEGFMGKAHIDAVCEKMTLADEKTIWSLPIVFDISQQEIDERGIEVGDTILLNFAGNPLAIMEVEEIFTYDKDKMARATLGTTDIKHPGVRMIGRMRDRFIGGKITLVNKPKFNPPFNRFFYTPIQLRKEFKKKDWLRIVAHQTKNVPHTGYEWLMKGTWFCANGDASVEKLQTGILVNCIIGSKRIGDYIDEAIVLTHQALNEGRYFRNDVHMVSITYWDMRYAGAKEAIFHAIVGINLGCTHHIVDPDHGGVGDYYGSYDAQRIFDQIPPGSLKIKPMCVLEWWYCPMCAEVTYSGLCGHTEERKKLSGTLIRSIIKDGGKSSRPIFRPQVFDVLMECAERYGFGSPFCTEEYLAKRQPVFTVPPLA